MTRMRRLKCAAALLLIAGCLSAQAPPDPRLSPASTAPVPALLLITIGTWRWDYIGVSGAGRVETPNLDRIAKEGVYDPEALTSCPLTTPAHASILTGLDPLRHGILDCTRYKLNPSVPTLAEAFQAEGHATAAFVASETLKARFGLSRGFDVYDDSGMTRRKPGDWNAPSRDGSKITEAFLRYLSTLTAGRGAFASVHYFDLHLPYKPRPAFDKKYPRDNYAAQAAFVDAEIGRILEALKADTGRAWRIVVVGDHGEGLGERGEDTHGIGLYRGTLHVPLILYPKPERALALAKPWGLVDLSPTLREWFGLPAVAQCDGMSLFRKDEPGRVLSAVSAEPSLLFGVEPSLGIRQGTLLYLRGGGEELYDLGSDPGETRDLSRSPERRSDLARLRGMCDKTWPVGWLEGALPPSLKASPEDLKNLQSLGYLSGSVPSGGKVQRLNIRDVMKDKSDWDRAREVAFRTGKDDGLLDLYARLVPKYPRSYALRNWYGPLLARVGRKAEAVELLETATRFFPRDDAALVSLGGIYLSERKAEKARDVLQEALARNPDSMMAHKLLGVVYADHLVNPVQAIKHFKIYLGLGGDEDAPKWRQYIELHEERLRHPPKSGNGWTPGGPPGTPSPLRREGDYG